MMMSEISKEDMQKGAEKFISLMSGMIVLMIAISLVIFIAVMYLLRKLEIDRSSYSISLLKALGYSEREVNSFYLGSSLYMTLASIVIGMPARPASSSARPILSAFQMSTPDLRPI